MFSTYRKISFSVCLFPDLISRLSRHKNFYCLLIPFIFLLFPADLQARDKIKIVGSGTVYPYASAVAKAYAKRYGVEIPKIVPGGSGSGFRQFCAGIGEQFPDITNASRPMKYKEWELCQKNGVKSITEVKFGNDGIALVTSKSNTKIKNLSVMQLYKAIAEYVPVNGKMVRNPYRNWQEISPSLPNQVIQLYGPSVGDGTYYVMTKILIRQVCQHKIHYFRNLKKDTASKETYQKELKKYCTLARSDGNYISLSAGPEQILKVLKTNQQSLFFIGYSVLFTNRDKLNAISINNIEPRVYTISDKSYALNRPLYFYIKNQHRKLSPQMGKYLKEFMSSEAMDTFGYLIQLGLGVLSFEELRSAQYAVAIGRKMRRFHLKKTRIYQNNL